MPHLYTEARIATAKRGHVTGISLASDAVVRVWLSRKLAEFINGIDLRGRHVGDVLELGAREAALLLAEGFAELDRRVSGDRRGVARSCASQDRRRGGKLPR